MCANCVQRVFLGGPAAKIMDPIIFFIKFMKKIKQGGGSCRTMFSKLSIFSKNECMGFFVWSIHAAMKNIEV
jgi:hypothetical protein